MKSSRRSFFSLLGCAGAAKAAGIPEPEKVEALEPGGIYAVYVQPLSSSAMEHVANFLGKEGERLGVKFILFPEGLRLAKLD